MKITPAQRAAIDAAAAAVGVSGRALDLVIRHESGYNPAAKNPLSSARGLLQWIDSTARGLGYRDSADLVKKNPTFEAQLNNVVVPYLKGAKGFKNDLELYSYIFLGRKISTPAAPLSAREAAANPGIKTFGDYVRRFDPLAVGTGAAALFFLLLICAALYLKKNQ